MIRSRVLTILCLVILSVLLSREIPSESFHVWFCNKQSTNQTSFLVWIIIVIKLKNSYLAYYHTKVIQKFYFFSFFFKITKEYFLHFYQFFLAMLMIYFRPNKCRRQTRILNFLK